MSPSEFIILVVLLGVVFYWIDTIFVKEVACQHGKDKCRELGVTFLDATVEITKVRLKRNAKGTVKFKRDYSFEFSSDGIRRYQGNISMLGKVLMDLSMSAYPEAGSAANTNVEIENKTKSNFTFDSSVIDFDTAKKKNKKHPTDITDIE